MYHNRPESLEDLQKPIYFYYSSCYFEHNHHRLYKRWQVGRGNTSWDVGISDLKYKGCPRLDIAMIHPNEGILPWLTFGPATLTRSVEDSAHTDTVGEESFSFNSPNLPRWLRPLFQFRNYDGLNLSFYTPVESPEGGEVAPASYAQTQRRKEWVLELKDFLRGGPEGVQGPRICAFFAGRPYADGESSYVFG
jgi:hypothetical protein